MDVRTEFRPLNFPFLNWQEFRPLNSLPPPASGLPPRARPHSAQVRRTIS